MTAIERSSGQAPDSPSRGSRIDARTASSQPRDTSGYFSSGQSPGAQSPGSQSSGSLSSASPPTLHLVGAGKVGRAFLARVRELPVRLVAVSDASGTVYDRLGLDAGALAAHKAAGRSLAELPQAEAIPTELAIGLVAADIVVDATPTDEAGTAAAVARVRAALRLGAFVALCGKNALAAHAAEWLTSGVRRRLGIDAVLGGAGRLLQSEIDDLRARCQGLVLVGNVTSTVLIEAIEAGGSLDDGLAAARERGLLEADATRDLDGSDAATKLALVAGAVFGEPFVRAPDPAAVGREDLRQLDPERIRERRRRGMTTRLVARGDRSGRLRVAFDEVRRGSLLDVPADRVVYGYQMPDGVLMHTGLAVGADLTAAALAGDVRVAIGAEVRP